jgi:Protein of unknown function (DUF1580)
MTVPASLTSETLLSLTQAARRLPPGRRGRPVSISCVLRWLLDGVPGPDGRRIRLEAVRLGGRWVTSAEAIQRFAEALTPQLGDVSPDRLRPPASRRRQSERAAKALEEMGM